MSYWTDAVVLSISPAVAGSCSCLVHFQLPLEEVKKEQECVSSVGQHWDLSGLAGDERGVGKVQKKN